MRALLGIDLGTSSVKVVVSSLEGAIQGLGTAEYPILTPKPGYAEQNATDWWTATATELSVSRTFAWIEPSIDNSRSHPFRLPSSEGVRPTNSKSDGNNVPVCESTALKSLLVCATGCALSSSDRPPSSICVRSLTSNVG